MRQVAERPVSSDRHPNNLTARVVRNHAPPTVRAEGQMDGVPTSCGSDVLEMEPASIIDGEAAHGCPITMNAVQVAAF